MKIPLIVFIILLFQPATCFAKQVAIVIDDIGYHQRDLNIINLPGQVSFSILPHTPYAKEFAQKASQADKELLLHIPMQATDASKALGPGGLTTDMNKAQLQQTLSEALSSLPQVKGVNNHMGSELTQQSKPMKWTMELLKERHLYFLDSRTTSLSQAQNAANFYSVENVARHVFLDNILTKQQLTFRMNELKYKAQKYSFAIAIAHPYPETVAFLTQAIPELEAQGFELVPLSQIIKQKYTHQPKSKK